MKKIERKGFNSRREMDVIDALNEVRMLNKRLGNVDHDRLLGDIMTKHHQEQSEIEDKQGVVKSSVLETEDEEPTESELKKKFIE